MTPTVYTIGVYGLTDNEFFQRLVDNKIELFIDIRQRRAVRGSKYALNWHQQWKLEKFNMKQIKRKEKKRTNVLP